MAVLNVLTNQSEPYDLFVVPGNSFRICNITDDTTCAHTCLYDAD